MTTEISFRPDQRARQEHRRNLHRQLQPRQHMDDGTHRVEQNRTEIFTLIIYEDLARILLRYAAPVPADRCWMWESLRVSHYNLGLYVVWETVNEILLRRLDPTAQTLMLRLNCRRREAIRNSATDSGGMRQWNVSLCDLAACWT